MEKLVNIEGTNHLYTTSKIVAEKLSRTSTQHRNVIITIEKMVKEKELWSMEQQRGDANALESQDLGVRYVSTNGHAIITESTYTVNNRKHKMYKLNESAFYLLVMNLSRYKNARILQHEFINAFQKMKQLIKHQQETIHDLVAHGIAPVDPINTKSRVNNKKRDKLVRSYYRSSRGKKDGELNEAIKLTQLEFDFYKA